MNALYHKFRGAGAKTKRPVAEKELCGPRATITALVVAPFASTSKKGGGFQFPGRFFCSGLCRAIFFEDGNSIVDGPQVDLYCIGEVNGRGLVLRAAVAFRELKNGDQD